MRKKFLIPAIVLLAAATTAPAAAEATGPHESVRRALDQVVASGAVGAQVRVTRDGQTWTARAGTARVSSPAPVPANGRFRAASTTKMLVATAVLQLVGESRIALDSPVDRYLPGLLPDGGRITVRMLLQHTSGLYDYLRDIPLSGKEFVRDRFRHYSPRQLVGISTGRPRDFEPGTGWRYSNTNYVVAGLLIEAVTHRPWDREVTDRILRPLGMVGSSFPGDSPVVAGPHAHGYVQVDGRPVDITEFNPSLGDSAGALVSTTADLDRFVTALVGGRLLQPAQFTELTRIRQITADTGYGLGFAEFATSCGVKVWGHDGLLPGYFTFAFSTLDQQRRYQGSVNARDTLQPGSALDKALVTLLNTTICG